MFNHYVKKDLAPIEATNLVKQAFDMTLNMRIAPAILCIDSDKVWDEEKIEWRVTKKRVNVYGYFYDDESEIASKLSQVLDLASSF